MLNMEIKEIGSEFWNVPTADAPDQQSLFPLDTVWYQSGRVALGAVLDHILQKHALRTAALPSWCCDSMIKPFLMRGIQVKFYSVYLDDSRHLVQETENFGDCDILLQMDYFGLSRTQRPDVHSIVLRDITHSLFSEDHQEADYYFGSLRKWTGVWTGGFAFCGNGDLLVRSDISPDAEYVSARKNAMNKKRLFIEEGIGDKQFLSIFGVAEEWLDQHDACAGASERDIAVAQVLDIVRIREQRKQNAAYLLDHLPGLSFVTEMPDGACPLFVPVFLPQKQRDALKKYLIGRQIYCPVHWPVTQMHQLNDRSLRIYQEEISLICDQRYGLQDMERICDEIHSFL